MGYDAFDHLRLWAARVEVRVLQIPAQAIYWLTAEDSAQLPAMAEALDDSEVTSRVRGDFLLLDADQPRGFRVNPQRLSGDVNWLTQFRWGFGKRPLLLFFLMCVIFAVLVILLVPLLKWRQARRLGE